MQSREWTAQAPGEQSRWRRCCRQTPGPGGLCSPVAPLDPGIALPTLALSSGPRPGPPRTLGKAQLLRWGLVTPENLDPALVLRCERPSAWGLSCPRPPSQTWSWGTFTARPSDAPNITHEAGRARLQETHLGAGNPHQLHLPRSRPGRRCTGQVRLQPWGELTIRKRASHGSTRSSKALFTVGCVSGQSSGEGPASPRGARRNRVEQGGELGGGQESQGRVGGCPRPPRGWARRAEDSWVGAPPGQGSGPWDPCALPTAPPSAGFPRLRPLNYRPSGLTGPVSSLTKLTHPCGAQLPEPAA